MIYASESHKQPRNLKILFLSLLLLISTYVTICLGAGLSDMPFIQEYHEPYPITPKGAANDVRAIAIDTVGNIYAATKAGVYRLDKGEKQWLAIMKKSDGGPAYDIVVDSRGVVWAGAWNGIYRSTPSGLKRVAGINHPVPAICATENEIIALGEGRIYRLANGKLTSKEVPYSKSFRAVIPDKKGGLWIATGLGLYHHADTGHKLYQTESQLISPDLYDIAFDSKDNLWIGGLGGVTVYKGQRRLKSFTPEQGLPSVSVRCVAQGPDGLMWIGTSLGIARYDGKGFSIRHSKRWLLSNDVRDIAFDSDGTAWIATANGVSAIKRKSITLAEKSDYFLEVCLARHVREPYIVEKCLLTTPGDTSNFKPRDDDNDGQYTAMYLAMESFRYAATKDPRAKSNAKGIRSPAILTDRYSDARLCRAYCYPEHLDFNGRPEPQNIRPPVVRDVR